METTVIFDLDGVLVDSRAAIAGCMNHALTVHRAAHAPGSRPARLHRPTDLALVRRPARAGAGGPRGGGHDRRLPRALRDGVADRHDGRARHPRGAGAARRQRTGSRSRPPSRRRSPSRCSTPSGCSGYFDVIAGPSFDERAEPKTETLRGGARAARADARGDGRRPRVRRRRGACTRAPRDRGHLGYRHARGTAGRRAPDRRAGRASRRPLPTSSASNVRTRVRRHHPQLDLPLAPHQRRGRRARLDVRARGRLPARAEARRPLHAVHPPPERRAQLAARRPGDGHHPDHRHLPGDRRPVVVRRPVDQRARS